MAARSWVLATTVLLLAVMWCVSAQAQCPPPPRNLKPAFVNMQVVEPKLVYRHDVDLFNLPKINNTMEKAPGNWVMLGVTISPEQLRLEAQTLMMTLPDKRVCVWLNDVVRATLGGPEMDVYVAANYRLGTCEYNVVLDHENTHVAINRAALHTHGPRIEAALKKAVATGFPMIFPNEAAAKEVINVLMQRVKPLQDAMYAEMRERNGAIDTPEAYRRTSARCNNWFPRGTRLPNGKIAS